MITNLRPAVLSTTPRKLWSPSVGVGVGVGVGESGQPGLALVDVVAMHFQTLDVYKCAIAFLPDAYRLAKKGDAEMASQLKRAALSINLNIAEGTGRFGNDERRFLVIARGSAFECAAILDALQAIGVVDSGMKQALRCFTGSSRC